MVKPSIIQIHPGLDASAVCPKCHSDSVDIHGYLFQGIHIMVDCTCRLCKTTFFHTLPVAHDADTPIAVSHDGKHVRYDPSAKVWLAEPLIDGLLNEARHLAVGIQKKNLEPLKDKLIILNCLDDCFGHAFVKLLNAQQLLREYPGYSLVLLITPNLEWMVPSGVSELWIVQGSMRNMGRYITTLQGFLKSEINRTSKCFVSTAKVFHSNQDVDSELFLKAKPFDLESFDSLPYTITFALREDRFWHANRLDDFINRVFIKLDLRKYFNGYFIRRQNRLVERTIDLILKHNPGVQINITGMGASGQISRTATDLRTNKITPDIERQWCSVYSMSHVIIGVHGSNMLIPTALAAGFINIIPPYKIPHVGEDTVLHHAGRKAILLGRHVDGYASPSLVAEHAINILGFGASQS